MKSFLLTLTLGLSLCAAASASELLLNGNFEGPALTTNGDHIGSVPTSWTVADPSTPTTEKDSLSNLTRGVVTNGTGATPATYLPLCPDDKTTGADQSLDGNGQTVIVSQTFILSTALTTALQISVDFGGRDATSGTGTGSSWQLVNTATNAVIASSTAASTPATGSWVKSSLLTGNLTLPAATYRFNVTLADPDQVDAATITTVPEPSAFALAGGLLVAGLGFRLVRARRAA